MPNSAAEGQSRIYGRAWRCISALISIILLVGIMPLQAEEKAEDSDASIMMVMPSIVKNINDAAQKSGVKSLSIVAFSCNGGKTTALSTSVRDKMLEEFIDAQGVEVYDRMDSKLVTQEGGISFEGASFDASSALLVGEVFCNIGDPQGYFAYRVFRTSDTRIIASGCVRIAWSKEEKDMFYGDVRGKEQQNTLPCIDAKELQKLTDKMKRVTEGMAICQEGGMSAENEIPHRMAYAQIIPTLMAAGNKLYEREYFTLVAKEVSLSDNAVLPEGGGVSAVGYMKLTSGSGTDNQLKVQVTGYPNGKLLATVNIIQKKGSAIGGAAASTDATPLAKPSDMKLTYEYEIFISDDYRMPESIPGFVTHYKGTSRADIDPNPIKAKTLLQALYDSGYKKLMDVEKNKKDVLVAALTGYRERGMRGMYVGPLSLCEAEAANNLICVHQKRPYRLASFARELSEQIASGKMPMSGTFTMRGKAKCSFDYAISVSYADADDVVPNKVKCSIDFTRSKASLIPNADKK